MFTELVLDDEIKLCTINIVLVVDDEYYEFWLMNLNGVSCTFVGLMLFGYIGAQFLLLFLLYL
jgi:hypothetical protein